MVNFLGCCEPATILTIPQNLLLNELGDTTDEFASSFQFEVVHIRYGGTPLFLCGRCTPSSHVRHPLEHSMMRLFHFHFLQRHQMRSLSNSALELKSFQPAKVGHYNEF